MNLIIGGAYQGKKQFTSEMYGLSLSEFVDGRVCPFGSLKNAKAVHHFQDYVKRMLLDGIDAQEEILKEIDENSQLIIICNELGCGLVPMEAFDRRYRETVGRLQCEIAKKANEVYRVYCGIGEKLK